MEPAFALAIARWLVLFLHRTGNQSQFSAQLAEQTADRPALRELQRWIGDHLASDLGLERMAERAAMSRRHFSRRFHREVGTTPARYVEKLRLEAARRRLEESEESTERIAAQCELGSAEIYGEPSCGSWGWDRASIAIVSEVTPEPERRSAWTSKLKSGFCSSRISPSST